MEPKRVERLIAIVLILLLAGFFGYGLGYVNEDTPHLAPGTGGWTPPELMERREWRLQASLDSYGERYAIRKHEGGLEGAMIGVGLALIGLALVPVAVRLRIRLRSRRTQS